MADIDPIDQAATTVDGLGVIKVVSAQQAKVIRDEALAAVRADLEPVLRPELGEALWLDAAAKSVSLPDLVALAIVSAYERGVTDRRRNQETAGPVAEASATGPEEEDGGGGATAGRGNPACAAPASLSQPDGAVTGGTPEIHSFIGRADAALLRRVAEWFDTNPRRVLIGLWSTGFGGPLDVVLQVITELDEEVGP